MLTAITMLTIIIHLGLASAIASRGHFFRAALASVVVLALPVIWTLAVGAPASDGMGLLLLLPIFVFISLCLLLAGVAQALSRWLRRRPVHADDRSTGP
jgi:hypothetical protein